MKKGYHLHNIRKGKLGDSSKIREEVDELIDAEAQGCKIMALVELSDMVGAIELYLAKHFPGMTLRDLETMSHITQRAFKNGFRS
jgi:hypothetical protein